MALEALVTALACLSTTSPTVTEHHVPIIMRNSIEPFRVDNTTGNCPVGALGGLMTRIEYMTDQLKLLKADLMQLQELITEYKNEAPIAPIESRIYQPLESFAMTSVSEVNEMPPNCLDQKHGQVRIQIETAGEPFYVNCDQKVRNGGWLVIAYRYDGSEDFNRDWHAYKSGFGALNAEFFIGLDKLHRLTIRGDYELLIIMRSKTGEERFALYDLFSIGSENEKYLLNVLGAYRGDAGDSLRYHAGKKFTTFDQDNDDNGQNCARTHAGAWWYGRECFESNLFGTFQFKYGQEIGYFKGILWKTFVPGPTGSLRYVRMLIRPKPK
ncbi:LOW QUALITY PROTEIN: fibrinogen-like protein A [Drosophila nasuta]|uniref:Fibrinogen-like protein A isoform X1 n=2 Tax=Drosophila albomicans TaxID=7291 RepID=A0A6P8XYM4_DROAB|nr:fibrinogen-like protein A isoform X1 [Drosophila albomicans]XP_060664282.1 LOW QUALITY PROTEIN: fibrinogen-like protein A [Drosophila nasuta]